MNFKLEQQVLKHRMNWPFTVNHLSPQAQGLEVWFPCFDAAVGGKRIYDYVGGYHADSNTGNISWSAARPFGFIVPKLTSQGLQSSYTKSLQDFTITGWFYSTGQDNVFDRVFDKGQANGVLFFLNNSGIAEYKSIIMGTTSSGVTASFFKPHFYCIGRVGSIGFICLDGELKTSWGVSGSATDTSNFVIGANQAFSNTFGGDVWDIRIYNKALNMPEVLAMWHQDTRFDLLAPLGIEAIGNPSAAPVASTGRSQVIWFQ